MLLKNLNTWIAVALIAAGGASSFASEIAADALNAYRLYCQSRRGVLAAHGKGPLPDTPVDVQSDEKSEKIAYVEYRNFYQQYIARKLQQHYSKQRRGETVPVAERTIDYQNGADRKISVVALGRSLPLLVAYGRGNGSVEEAAAIQLLKSAACGPVYFSIESEKFNGNETDLLRSFAYGLMFADGLPDANALEKGCRIRNYSLQTLPEVVPQDEKIVEIPSLQKNFTDCTAALQSALPTRTLANAVEIVLSERTMTTFAGTLQGEEGLTRFLTLYGDFVANGIPAGVRFLETLPGYNSLCRMWIVPDAEVLSREEIAALRKIAEKGGTVLVTSRTGTFDEWGLPRTDKDMEYLRGIDYGAVKRFHEDQEWYENQVGRGMIITVPVSADVANTGDLAAHSGLVRMITDEQMKRFRGVLVRPAAGVITQTQRVGEDEFVIFAADTTGNAEKGKSLGTVDCTWEMIQLDPVTGKEIEKSKGFRFAFKESDFDCIRLKKAPPLPPKK